jgi:hypothetical protein
MQFRTSSMCFGMFLWDLVATPFCFLVEGSARLRFPDLRNQIPLLSRMIFYVRS